MPALTKQQINKLGNSLIYLSERVGELNKTKILKLLFLLEEASIKKYGYPFFGIDFQLWVRGPVIKDIWIDLSEDNLILLKQFIKRADYDKNLFVSVSDFNDDEFSDNDIELLEIITQFAKNKNAKDIVEFTHNDNSLWKKSAVKNGVYEDLINEKVNSTEHLIDFSLLFEDNNFLRNKYQNAIENKEFINHLKK